MESMDNVWERIEALEQQLKLMGAHTRTVERRLRGWRRLWRVAALAAWGLALALPLPVWAETFRCRAGDVPCLIDAINQANANGDENTLTVRAGTYTLTAVDNDTEGPNGLPPLIRTATLPGA